MVAGLAHQSNDPDPLCRNAAAVAFVRQFTPLFTPVAAHLRTPLANILGLAARETGYGKGRFFAKNALFNMETSVGRTGEQPSFLYPFSNGWQQASGDPRVFVASYPTPFASLQSFSARCGAAVMGIKDPKGFLSALKNAGFNKRADFNDPTVLEVVARRLACL